ncbi:hypothetical protein [Microbulbifer spongiae]|uniref:Lipoprotein n=1 Tax=Microbulbifer spongiae TaxID=2944933 RepID=A0ABY9E9V2_9GAMM|nr:hypothetical protein [Microbulbifer sp. MI-G]WKD48922.1 hypothetical protein M8T91_13600 [Microbulbifer sp. MI-G]
MKKSTFMLFCLFILGCSHGRIDILDKDEKVVGYCSENFYLHWYGAHDSVDYILYLCAKEHIEKGYRISDDSIIG